MSTIFPVIDEYIISDERFILINDDGIINLNKNNTIVWTTIINDGSSRPYNSYLSTKDIILSNLINHKNLILIYSFNYKNNRCSFLYKFTSVIKYKNEFILHSYDNPIEL